MTTRSHAGDAEQGFVPLASLLRTVEPLKLYDIQQRVRSFGRDELLVRYRAAFRSGRRKPAYVLANALVAKGVPPWVWHDEPIADGLSINMRYDLFLADVMWLRRHHADHADAIRYQRGKLMLTGGEAAFHREAEYAFYKGKRPAWKLVGSLSLTIRQQWGCAWLRSAPIKKRAAETMAVSEKVYRALHDDLCTVRRTATFGELEASATLRRRHALWRCSRMVDGPSPPETARIFEQLTGAPLTRQAAAQQLEKIRGALCKSEMTLGL